MSLDPAVQSGQPVTYWMFRNLVWVVQILVMAAVFAGCVIWALNDENGLKVWAEYTAFSKTVSDWGSQLHLPWG